MNVGGSNFTRAMNELLFSLPPAVGAASAVPTGVETDPAPATEASRKYIEELLRWIEQLEQHQRVVDAARMEFLAAALSFTTDPARPADRELEYRALRAEVAAILGVSEYAAEAQLNTAYTVRRSYRATLSALASAEIGVAHARVIADAGVRIGVGIDPLVQARRAAFEEAVLEHARRETPNRLRPIARRIAEGLTPEPLDEMHRSEVRRRRVTVREGEYGMSELTAFVPTIEAFAIHDRLTQIAREVERVRVTACAPRDPGALSDEPHTCSPSGHLSRDEIRADAFVELLLGADTSRVAGCEQAGYIRARVQVVTPIEALEITSVEPLRSVGLEAQGCVGAAVSQQRISDESENRSDMGAPVWVGDLKRASEMTGRRGFRNGGDASIHRGSLVAELVGAGPIPIEGARRVAAAASSWDRVAFDSESGRVLTVDRYRPSEQMRRLLAARDQHCRFPGCRVPIARCDLDHTIDAATGGSTSTDNLAHLCRGHHVVKHHTAWAVRQRPGGELIWTSPSGRKYRDRPASQVRFAPVSQGAAGQPAITGHPAKIPATETCEHREPF
ncbi:DUF222 domain-containing protein [Leucobacter sp. USHLN153]|uniref:HNH endonuclease signature motif containing protein n=1 Tax=Leucobacter sp. USHLN153 TaxID=3081268 RepID=UPI003FA5F1F4